MKQWLVAAAAFAAALTCAVPATAGNTQLAYFKAGNITRSGLQGTHTVALTFDDGPNANTREVLRVLRDYDVKATFFVVGDMAASHPGTLRMIAEDGHLLANHSADHARLNASVYGKRPSRLIAELRDVHDLIAPLMQPDEPLFFRAPYGAWGKRNSALLNADPILQNYAGPIYWDEGGNTAVDDEGFVRTSADWDCWHRGWTAQTCAKGYLREIAAKDGGVVLMHCIDARSAGLVEAVVPVLQANGYKFIRLDEVQEYLRYQGPPPEIRPAVTAMGPLSGIGR